ncbi:CD209 antigen-like protein C [Brienomyrus brachyistius]|uniref:CD209 antigen-like protein C n=1 Tax=Brienomyrus brachyistius TaxID=42636 RepID=UPI0020B33225|nr:CD209 antigen-like protein C [Brienomyrus brachyistius]
MSDDIYTNADIIQNNEPLKGTSSLVEQTSRRSQHSGSEPAGARRYRLAIVCLGMLCLLLLLISTVIYVYFKGALNEAEKKGGMLTAERDQLQVNYSIMAVQVSQLEDKMRRFAENRCPEGWNSFHLKCYYISGKKNTWVKSQEECRQKGADLVVIDSKEEQIFLSQFQRTWIGLIDKEHKGIWTWVDGTPLTTSYWASGEPNDFDIDEDCVEIRLAHETLKNWNDLPCSAEINWICEQGGVN